MSLFSKIGRDASLQVNARADDFLRMSKLLTSYQGAKFLANQALLRASNFNGEDRESIAKTAIDTAVDVSSVTASLLSQVAVNGTGTHFLFNEYGHRQGKRPYFTAQDNAAVQAKFGGQVNVQRATILGELKAKDEKKKRTGPVAIRQEEDAFHMDPTSVLIEDGTNATDSDLQNLVNKDTLPVVLSVADDSHSTLAFRGFVNGINDSFSANWNTVSYVGRNEPLYIYDSTTRTLGFTLQIPIFSSIDTKRVYQKVDILMSNMYGKYTDVLGLNQGTIMKLRVGDYFKGFGIMTSLTHAIEQAVPWSGTTENDGENRLKNGDRDLILPQVITLGLSFNVIHTYMPSRTTKEKLNNTQLMYFVAQEGSLKKESNEE
jgi:hypothetical protein